MRTPPNQTVAAMVGTHTSNDMTGPSSITCRSSVMSAQAVSAANPLIAASPPMITKKARTDFMQPIIDQPGAIL